MMNHSKLAYLASAAFLLVVGSGCSTTGQPQISLRAGTRIGGDVSVAAGQAYLVRADYGLAIEEFRKVLRDEPDSPAAIQGLAMSYDRLQRFDLSDRYFQEALALSPRDPGVYRAYASSLRAQGRLDDAAVLAADMETMLGAGLAAGSAPDRPVDVAAAAAGGGPGIMDPAAARQAETLTLPPMTPPPAAIAQAEQAAPRGARLERISLSEVKLVTRNTVPVSRVSIDITALMAAPISTPRPTRIMNAVGRPGIAGRFRGYLAARGWSNLEKGDAAIRLERSRVIYPPANRAEALRLIRSLPFPAVAVPRGGADRILVLVGRNALAFDKAHRAARTT
jgi:hypothetical protein